MTEILTESFCERCGTRYTFESAAPRRSRLGRVRTVSKGLRNFVLSDETTLSEAMADARSEEELAATASQLDAFHKTFNFCMSCRQYTCASCWNQAEGRCLTCAPHLGHEIMPAPLGGALPMQRVPLVTENGHEAGPGDGAAGPEVLDAWPEADLDPDRLARVLGGASVLPDPTAPAEWPEAEPLEAEAGLSGEAAPDALVADVPEAIAPEAPVDAEPEALAAEPEPVAVAADVAPVAFDEPAAGPGPDLAAGTAPEPAAPDATPVREAEAPLAEAPAAHPAAPALIGLAAGQSLEDAIAAYEASLVGAAEDEAAEDHAAELAAAGDAAPTEHAVDAPPQLAAEPAFEPDVVAAEPAPEFSAEQPAAAVAPPAAVEAGPELAAEPAIEPVAVAPEVAAEPAVAAMAAEPATAPPPVMPGQDVVPQPTWPVTPAAAGPVAPGTEAPPPVPAAPVPLTPASPWLTVAPEASPGAEPPAGEVPPPQWPATPQWPAPQAWAPSPARRPEPPRTLAGRPLLNADAAGLWAASDREVRTQAPTAAAGAQPCVSCGLSLSANARFCRRCGSPQG